MPDFNVHQLEKSITHRYTLAVFLIALLSTGAFYALKSALSDSDSTALIVNISGKQRMLSQHIALDVHRVYRSQFNRDSHAYNLAITSLKARAQEMADANKRLSSGVLTDKFSVSLSNEIREMYFGEMNLSERVHDYTQLAFAIIKSQNYEDSLRILKAIDKVSETLLFDLNHVVFQYQREGEARLQLIARMELALWLFTLLTLVLEVLFIFRPLARSVAKSAQAEKELLNSLQDQVELRTLKLEQANQQLYEMASKDHLTGVKNRLTLETDVEEIIAGNKRHQQHFGLVMADIDWFKKVNDTFGHDFGDYVLKEFATLLKQHVREPDFVYRIGGEEFVVIFNRISLEDLTGKVEELRSVIQNHSFKYGENETVITASFGVYHSSLLKADSYQEVLKSADHALYDSKSYGRDQINFAKQDSQQKRGKLLPKQVKLQYEDGDLSVLLSAEYDIESLTGYSAQQLIDESKAFKHLVYSQDWDQIAKVQQELVNGEEVSFTVRLLTAAESVRIARVSIEQINGVYQVLIQSATALAKEFGDELLVFNFHAMMDKTNDHICFKDNNHVYTAASQTLLALTSVKSREELLGKTDYELFPKKVADESFQMEKELFNGEIDVAQKIQQITNKEGRTSWVDNRKYPIKDGNGKILGLFGIARIIPDEEIARFYQKTQQD